MKMISVTANIHEHVDVFTELKVLQSIKHVRFIFLNKFDPPTFHQKYNQYAFITPWVFYFWVDIFDGNI